MVARPLSGPVTASQGVAGVRGGFGGNETVEGILWS
jgi:hypothetical protein